MAPYAVMSMTVLVISAAETSVPKVVYKHQSLHLFQYFQLQLKSLKILLAQDLGFMNAGTMCFIGVLTAIGLTGGPALLLLQPEPQPVHL